MWFWLSLISLFCWSCSDLFSKIGCKQQDDKLSHLKMVSAVGFVMGIHCLTQIIQGVPFSASILIKYLPVSLLYIFSMTIGYLGLRYIELSISSPICNSSGALVAVLTLITVGKGAVNNTQIFAVLLVVLGVVSLGFVEAGEDDQLRSERQREGNQFYSKSLLAILIPVIYCLLDALGTFADSLVLETLDEASANSAYEFTFFVLGFFCFIYVRFIKKDSYSVRQDLPKVLGACFETAGQFAYIFALGDSQHVMLSAPIISSYCVLSVIWGRIFLKEKLSKKHYGSILLVIIGVIIIGIFDV